jgi:hypothetical protein
MHGRLPTLSELVEKGKNQHIPFLLVSCLSLFLTINARQLLPERFLRDNNYINLRINTRISYWNDSFELTVSIYKFFNLASSENSFLVSLFSWVIGFCPYFLLYRMHKKFNLTGSILLYTGILLLPFYYFGYTKELISSIVCLVLVIAAPRLNTNLANIFLPLLFLIVGIIFRSYWILISAVFIALTLTGKYHRRLPNVLRIIGIPVCSIALVLICQIAGISEVNRARLNPQQTFSDVATNSLLPGVDLANGFTIIAQNIFQVFFGVVFPISVYKIISFYSFFAIFLCAYLSSIVLLSNWEINRGATLYKYHYFPVSFMIVQLIFEPDLGSYVRHIVPFIPILLMQIINKKSLHWISGMQNRKLHK